MLSFREGNFENKDEIEIKVEDQLEYKIKFDELMVEIGIFLQRLRIKFPSQTEYFQQKNVSKADYVCWRLRLSLIYWKGQGGGFLKNKNNQNTTKKGLCSYFELSTFGKQIAKYVETTFKY